MENEKTTIICGVYHEMTEEEKNNFIKMMSDDGKYNVVFDDGNTTPKLVEMSLPFLKT
jgi:hypothetical protein